MSATADMGLIGLGVMGRGLADNLTGHGHEVATHEPLAANGGTLEDLVAGLTTPRRILIMVKAGEPVDLQIKALAPLLEAGDMIIDGGNSHYRDSMNRARDLAAKGVLFIDAGISGGEAGARDGVSLMAGGPEDALTRAESIFTDISAADGYGHVGSSGAGHFVKMVHNGIEYALMQVIAEATHLLRHLGGHSYPEMQDVFTQWNQGDLSSYLVEITAHILATTDGETDQPLLEVIHDRAGQKGTGQWAAAAALELGVPAPTIAEAVFARSLSAQEQRLPHAPRPTDGAVTAQDLEKAVLAAMICAYAQGFEILCHGAAANGWPLKPTQISRIWQNGSIVRARPLEWIGDEGGNLLGQAKFAETLERTDGGLRQVVSAAALNAVPVPALSSALAYVDALRSERLWTNMIQAQRDYFGGHTYERTDKPGTFHTEWRK